MSPDAWGSALAFLLFVAPGLLFDLLSRRRHAGVEESAFREASRVALSSVAFSLPALAVVMGVSSQVPQLRGVARAAEAGQLRLMSADGFLGLLLVLAQLGLACFFAAATHNLLQTFRPDGNITIRSGWTRALRDACPRGHEVFVRARLASGSIWTGRVASFSPDLEPDQRELVLMPPLTSAAAGKSLAPVAEHYKRVVLPGPEIVSLAVQYRLPRTAAKHKGGAGPQRSEDTAPAGRAKPGP